MLPVFLTVESNLTGVGRSILARARIRGYEPVVLSSAPEKFPFLEADSITVIKADTGDGDSVARLCAEHPVLSRSVGVFSPLDLFCGQAAAAARRLGIPGHDPERVASIMDKHAVRLKLTELGLNTVSSGFADTPAKAAAEADRIGFPVVLKPRRAAGAVAARLCLTSAETLTHAAEILKTPRSLSVDTSGIVVEQAVFGRQFDVHVFDGRVVAISEVFFDCFPYFRAIGFDCPAVLSDDVAYAITTYVERIAISLGLDWGPLDVEIKLSNEGEVHLIEINPRLVSGKHVELLALSLGIDMIEATIDACVGNEVDLSSDRVLGSSLRYLMRSNGPRQQGILMLPSKEFPEVVQFHVENLGGVPTFDYRDRIGHIITVAASTNRANSAIELAVAFCQGG
jgi:argininosuccinate lyase